MIQQFQESFSYFHEQVKNFDISLEFNDNDIFDTYCAISKAVEKYLQEWRDRKETMLGKWRAVYKDLVQARSNLKVIVPLVQFLFTLPGTNVDCERLFSAIKNYWREEKSQLQLLTLENVMKVKFNVNMTCEEFRLAIKDDVNILKKAKSSEKYQ